MKHVFLINPRAGKGDQTARLRALAERLAAAHGLEVSCLLTGRPGAAESLARALAETGEPLRLYVCGGDGTLHEAANGIAGYSNAAMAGITVMAALEYPAARATTSSKTSARTRPNSPMRRTCGTGRTSPWTSSTAAAGSA